MVALQLISNSILTIGNGTGPSHLAWGMKRISIVLFGPLQLIGFTKLILTEC